MVITIVQFLVEVGKAEDKAALVFLQDLCKRGIQLDDFIHCLEKINCQQAVRFFQPGASKCSACHTEL